MKRHKAGWVAKVILGGAVVLLGASHAAAQTTGARTGGGGGTGGGGAGSSGFGTAGNTGGGNTGGTPLSQGGGGGGGRAGTGGTSGTGAPSPTTSNSFNNFYSSVLAPGAGINKTLSSGNFSSTASGSGSSGNSTSGISSNFASGFTSGGTIQTIKQNSFTQPVFAVASTTTTGTTGTGTAATATGFSTYGTPRAPAYITTIGFDAPRTLVSPTVMQADLRRMLDGSSSLNGRAVQVVVSGGTVVLRGTLPTERQRRVAETMIRLTPGVREVRNEIQIPAEAVPPSQ